MPKLLSLVVDLSRRAAKKANQASARNWRRVRLPHPIVLSDGTEVPAGHPVATRTVNGIQEWASTQEADDRQCDEWP